MLLHTLAEPNSTVGPISSQAGLPLHLEALLPLGDHLLGPLELLLLDGRPTEWSV